MASTAEAGNATAPLHGLLESVLGRLAALESKVGISPPPAAPSDTSAVIADPPAVVAYDAYMESSVIPLAKSCEEIGDGLEKLSPIIREAWSGIRTIVVLASRSKKPANPPQDVQPHLKPVQKSLESLRKIRLDRKFDVHIKALTEMAGCLSWILMEPPPKTPKTFCDECIASSEFWSNKIRKEFKGKDEKQIAFCDALKAVGSNLAREYLPNHHKTGLTWNPRGVALAEAAASLESGSSSKVEPEKSKPNVDGGGAASLMAELEKKRSSDGSSAATGLKHVTRDQQTWRKEFKGEKSATVSAPAPAAAAAKTAAPKQKIVGTPKCEYQDRGSKWVVEHQTKESVGGKPLVVDVSDPKQQVYLFNCQHITLQVKGDKFKSIVLDKCQSVAVVFNTCISACEVVNSSKIQLQTTGLCPTFTIDKTNGCSIFLSEQSVDQVSFVASLSSEMNVSYPDKDGEYKELPIPEQFVHKLSSGKLTSEVSELYH